MFYRALRPLLFRMDPESAHHRVLGLSRAFQGALKAWYGGDLSPRLAQQHWGQSFGSPVGLAAGMDKNAEYVELWQALGLGFVEVGSVTARPSQGNPLPRLFRLPKDRALINRMGLNNHGAAQIASQLGKRRHLYRVPVGINLAKTHDPEIMGADAVGDFVESYRLLAPLADYLTLNVSCPNTTEGKTFEDPEALGGLLEAVGELRRAAEEHPPLLVKLSPPGGEDWQPDAAFEAMMEVLCGEQHGVDGLIIANTASSREGLQTPRQELDAIGPGGLSGRPLQEGALRMLRAVFARTEGRLVLIGVGGIDSAKSAYAMVRAGASLLQLYTGLVYHGPGLIQRIHKGLLRALDDDGFDSISDAVGADLLA